jgi:prophage DNA circulation protein
MNSDENGRHQAPPSSKDVFEQRRLQLLEQRNQVQESSLQSTRNALSMIAESEQVGIKTAEELLTQREKIEKVDEQLDTINGGLRQTQKDLNAMKGFFNGIRSLWKTTAKNPKTVKEEAVSKMSNSKSSSNVQGGSELATSINKLRSNSTQYEGLKRNASAPNTSDSINFGKYFLLSFVHHRHGD